MSVLTTEALPEITPEDLLQLPEGGKGFELVDGMLKELNVSAESSYTAGELVFILKRHTEPASLGYVFPPDAPFRCFLDSPKKVRRPDVAFIAASRYSAAQFRKEGQITVVPDLVVEVLSPNDLAREVNQKVQEWQNAGVRLIWVVDPETRLVFTHRPDGVAKLTETDTLTADPVLTGFSYRIADLFRIPAPKA